MHARYYKIIINIGFDRFIIKVKKLILHQNIIKMVIVHIEYFHHKTMLPISFYIIYTGTLQSYVS